MFACEETRSTMHSAFSSKVACLLVLTRLDYSGHCFAAMA